RRLSAPDEQLAAGPHVSAAKYRLPTGSVQDTLRAGGLLLRRSYDRRVRPKWRNWQTRRTQNPVPERACGFDPHLRHTEVGRGSREQTEHLRRERPVLGADVEDAAAVLVEVEQLAARVHEPRHRLPSERAPRDHEARRVRARARDD